MAADGKLPRGQKERNGSRITVRATREKEAGSAHEKTDDPHSEARRDRPARIEEEQPPGARERRRAMTEGHASEQPEEGADDVDEGKDARRAASDEEGRSRKGQGTDPPRLRA